MHWSSKLLLAFGSIVVVVVALVAYDLYTARPVAFETRVSGTAGELLKVSIPLEPHDRCVLVILPFIESGWGDPDVHIEGRLLSPSGEPLLSIASELVFGGERMVGYNRGIGDYQEEFPFAAPVAGKYVLELRVLSDHVDEVDVAVELEET